MSEKILNLTVHRNTRERRRRKKKRQDFRTSMNAILRDVEIDGYAVVAWDKDGNALPFWEQGTISASFLPEYVAGVIRRRLGMMDAEDVILGPRDEDV